MMIQCIAIDDEPLALTQITRYIEKVPFLKLIRACHSALEAMEIVSHEQIDLIFADINMPDLNGLDFVKSLVKKPLIIFTTAYSEYAIDGFRVDALDYLLKPFGYNDFLKASNKALRQYELMHPQSVTQPVAEQPNRYLFVKANYKMMRLEIDKIKYIESQSEYVKIYLEDEKPVMTLLSLKALEERLPNDKFMRVHRSYIANLSKIEAVSHNRIIYDKDTYVPIGNQYKDAFADYLKKYSLESFNK